MSGQGQHSAASFPEAADAFGSGGGDKMSQQQQPQPPPQSAGGLNDLLGLGRMKFNAEVDSRFAVPMSNML